MKRSLASTPEQALGRRAKLARFSLTFALLLAVAPAHGRQTPRHLAAHDGLLRWTLGGDRRPVLWLGTKAYSVHVEPGMRLRVTYGTPPNAWDTGLQELELRITWISGEERSVLFHERQTAAGADRWHEVIVPLSNLAGRSGQLEFSVSPTRGALTHPPLLFWTNPIIEPVKPMERTSFILISLDTLRSDHLGSYGYARPTSPNLDRLAQGGIRFSQAVSTSSWTVPAHASMLTGLNPERHGATKLGFTPLAKQVDTLAELLREQGYDTAAFTGGGFLNAFEQGFDRYQHLDGKGKPKTKMLQDTIDLAKAWVAADRNAPYFLFLHTYAVHIPYEPPPPYDTLFDPGYEGPFARTFTREDLWVLMNTPTREPRVLQHLIALYDGEIRYLDTQLGELFKSLHASESRHRTCLIVTSDHGEEFEEHGDLLHARAKLFDELLRVPLIVACPTGYYQGGRVVNDLVSLVDLTPTILDIAGAPLPKNLDGRSFEPLLLGESLPERPVLSHVDGSVEKLSGSVRAVRTSRYKWIDSPLDGTQRMFDLHNDPGEQSDVSAKHPDVAGELRALLPSVDVTPAPEAQRAATPTLDAATLERLRTLGYIP